MQGEQATGLEKQVSLPALRATGGPVRRGSEERYKCWERSAAHRLQMHCSLGATWKGRMRGGGRFWPKYFSAHTWLVRAYFAVVIFIKSPSVEYLYSIIYSLAVRETKANTNLVQKFKVCHLFSYCIEIPAWMAPNKINQYTKRYGICVFYITKENKTGPKET